MIEYFGLEIENIIYFILFIGAIICWKFDRLSRHIDELRERICTLEIGVEEEFDMDPIGLARKETDEK
jgi:hypothetical protein